MKQLVQAGVEVWFYWQIVSKLLTEKIIFAPKDRDGRRGFRFQATGTVEKLLAGRVPGRFPALVS